MLTEMEQTRPATYKCRVIGSVQRVGFRRFLQREADERQVRGWASNEQDGSLVVLFFGAPTAVGEMRQLLRQGPPAAEIITAAELLPDETDAAPPDSFDMR